MYTHGMLLLNRLYANHRVLIRYTLSGAVNAVFTFSFFPIFYWLLYPAVNINVIVTLGHVVCTLFSFTTHRYITFRSSGKIHHEGSKFFIMQGVNWAVNIVVLNLVLHYFDVRPFYPQMVIVLVLAVMNYFVLKYLIFLSPERKKA